WLAGATRMRWRTFALYKMLGGVCWACAIGIAAYYVGHSAENALSIFGVFGLIAVAVALVGFYVAQLIHKRRVAEEEAKRAAPNEGGADSAPTIVGHVSAVGSDE